MTEHGPGVRTALTASRPLADAFAAAGHRLFLVGGIVRDDRIGRERDDADYDLTTDARPEQIKALVGPIADAVWAQGERFGTIGCTIAGQEYEITTHRADTYDPDSRKPIVEFGDDVRDDLARRDFTINAMAVDVADIFPSGEGRSSVLGGHQRLASRYHERLITSEAEGGWNPDDRHDMPVVSPPVGTTKGPPGRRMTTVGPEELDDRPRRRVQFEKPSDT